MKIEVLGSGGAGIIPRPFCDCRICTEAAIRGVPYSRYGPAYFIHDINLLIDTPEEIGVMLVRSGIKRVDAVIYSHWHPDHTRGIRVWENVIKRWNWPTEANTVDMYLPEQVAIDFQSYLGLQESVAHMAQWQAIAPITLIDGETVTFDHISVKPFRVAEDYVYAFLLSQGNKHVLIAPDELYGWTPPDWLPTLDLAILPCGLMEFHPFSGQRIIPAQHPVLKHEATFQDTLAIIRQLDAKQVVLAHIDDSNQLSLDEYRELASTLRGGNISFAYDQQILMI